jgi:hypothetical protein
MASRLLGCIKAIGKNDIVTSDALYFSLNEHIEKKDTLS